MNKKDFKEKIKLMAQNNPKATKEFLEKLINEKEKEEEKELELIEKNRAGEINESTKGEVVSIEFGMNTLTYIKDEKIKEMVSEIREKFKNIGIRLPNVQVVDNFNFRPMSKYIIKINEKVIVRDRIKNKSDFDKMLKVLKDKILEYKNSFKRT